MLLDNMLYQSSGKDISNRHIGHKTNQNAPNPGKVYFKARSIRIRFVGGSQCPLGCGPTFAGTEPQNCKRNKHDKVRIKWHTST